LSVRPRFGYEIWILPKNHAAAFEQNTEEDILRWAHALRFHRETKPRPQRPAVQLLHPLSAFSRACETDYHWHIEIMPQLTRRSFEWGSGMFMNSIAPEIRQVIAQSTF